MYLGISPAKWLLLWLALSELKISCSFPDPDNPIMEPPPPPQQECLEGYTPYPYGCYRLLSTTQKSWDEMRDECRSHSKDTIKSDLVSIHSSAEDATLHISVMQIGVRAWIGLMENEVYICMVKNSVRNLNILLANNTTSEHG